MKIDLDYVAVAALLEEVGDNIALCHFRTLTPDQIHEKSGPSDLVTIADLECERELTQRLRALLAGSVVVGEEAVAADAEVLKRLSGSQPVWVIDPIDGTYNFARGNPRFGMLLALVIEGRTEAGWIYDPCGRHLAWAKRDEGAFLDNNRVRVQAPSDLAESVGAISRRYCSIGLRDHLSDRVGGLKMATTTRCAAHEYLDILTGRSHLSVYNRVKPWDHAAGILVVEEAGGFAALTDGSQYCPATTPTRSLIVAASQGLWADARRLLFADAPVDDTVALGAAAT